MMRAAALFALAASAAQAQSGGTATGCVVSSLREERIANATVTLRAAGSQPAETYITRTGADGCFSIADMPPGLYETLASKDGYERPRKNSAGPAEPRTVVVEAGKDAAPLRVYLTPDGVITGTVTDDSGDPVRRALIEVQQYGYANGKRQLRTVRSTGADDRGQYRLFYIPPGKYRLRANPSGRRQPIFGINVPIEALGEAPRGLAATYYPGSPDAAHASEIELAPGAELDGIDFHLTEQRLYSIRGRLLNLDEGRGINVVAQSIGERSISPVATRFVNKEYEIQGLAPGKYVVSGQMFPGPQEPRKYAREEVEIVNRDVDGIDLSLAPAVNIKGIVKAEGDVDLRNVAVNLVDLLDAFFPSSAHIATDGAVGIEAPPGLYRVEVSGQSVYLRSLAIGKDDVPDLKIDTAHLSGDLTLVIANDFGKVEGTVADDGGKPVADAEVTLLPAHPRDERDNRYFTVSTKADGSFSFSNVIPGDYHLFAWLGAEAGAPQDPEFRKPYEDRAVTVKLASSGHATVELKAIHIDR